MMYVCPAGYSLQIDLDANTQWCAGDKDPNQIVPAQPAQQAMGILGVSSLAALGLLLVAALVTGSRGAPQRRRR